MKSSHLRGGGGGGRGGSLPSLHILSAHCSYQEHSRVCWLITALAYYCFYSAFLIKVLEAESKLLYYSTQHSQKSPGCTCNPEGSPQVQETQGHGLLWYCPL